MEHDGEGAEGEEDVDLGLEDDDAHAGERPPPLAPRRERLRHRGERPDVLEVQRLHLPGGRHRRRRRRAPALLQLQLLHPQLRLLRPHHPRTQPNPTTESRARPSSSDRWSLEDQGRDSRLGFLLGSSTNRRIGAWRRGRRGRRRRRTRRRRRRNRAARRRQAGTTGRSCEAASAFRSVRLDPGPGPHVSPISPGASALVSYPRGAYPPCGSRW